MVRDYQPGADSRPAGDPHPINLADLKDILGKAIRYPDVRAKLLADPEAALKELNYIPSASAIAFFKTLDAASFDKAAAAFTPDHEDPAFGMAEM